MVAESLRAGSAAVEVRIWMRFGLTFGLNCGSLVGGEIAGFFAHYIIIYHEITCIFIFNIGYS